MILCLKLFWEFFKIGLFTFGGGYAMIPLIEETVLRQGWITQDALYNFIGVSEATPGPFAINIATFVGSTTAGFFGAVCATLGVVLPSFIIILFIASIFKKFEQNKYVKGALAGIIPVACALIISTGLLLLTKSVWLNAFDFSSQMQFDFIFLLIASSTLNQA